jgi:succinate-acetate transporter protein
MDSRRMPDGLPRELAIVRPLGSPMPLGLAGLAVASLLLSGVDLGWIPPAQSTVVGVLVLCTGGALQAVTSLIAFLARDGATASSMGLLSSGWMAIGLCHLVAPPAQSLEALGTLLLGIGVLAMLFCVGMASSKLLPALVIGLGGSRFVLTAVAELSAGGAWKTATGIVGLVVCVLAAYAAWALDLADAGRPLLPFGRRSTTSELSREPGVRGKL